MWAQPTPPHSGPPLAVDLFSVDSCGKSEIMVWKLAVSIWVWKQNFQLQDGDC